MKEQVVLLGTGSGRCSSVELEKLRGGILYVHINTEPHFSGAGHVAPA